MKRNIFLVFFFWELTTSLFAQRWTQKANFGGTARMDAIGFSIGDKGYIGLGTDGYPAYNFRKDLWEYNPGNDVWTQKADFGGAPRYDSFTFVIGTKAYVGVGWAPYMNDCWVYDQQTNAWTKKNNFIDARQRPVSFAIGGKGYVGVGMRSGNVLMKDFWEYDPIADSWTQKADFGGTPRTSSAGFAINSKGYIGTGADAFNGSGVNLRNDFWEYDPTTNVWTQRASFGGTPRWGAVGFSIPSCNKGYIGAGTDFEFVSFRNDFWEYDQPTDKWTRCDDYGVAQGSHEPAGFNIGSYGYVGTGYTPQTGLQKQFWKYTPGSLASFTTSLDPNCNGVSVHFTNSSSNASSYTWNFGDGNSDMATNPDHIYTNSGQYNVTLITDAGSCPSSVSHIIDIPSSVAIAGFLADIEPCEGRVIFTNTSVNAANSLFSFGDGDTSHLSNPHHLYRTSGKHKVTLTINKGTPCPMEITEDIETGGESSNAIFIPNAFTPNGDGKNDVFMIDSTRDCDVYDLMIFNRWGRLLLETTDIPLIWDGTYEGKPVSDGVYVYILKGKNFSKAGMVAVIR